MMEGMIHANLDDSDSTTETSQFRDTGDCKVCGDGLLKRPALKK